MAEGEERGMAAEQKDPMLSSADLEEEGNDRTAAQFKTKVVLAEHSPHEINTLWKKLQFETTPVDLTQFTRQHNILIENALTALAKNVRNLNENTKKSQEDILMNTKAIGRLSGKPVDTEEQDKKFEELLAQFEAFKDSTTQQITQLASEVSAQKAENAALKQEVGRLGPLAEQVKQMGQELAQVADTAAAAADVDFTPVWDATEQLVIRLGRVEAESEAHAKQIDHTLHVIATESAADDVLQNLDEADLNLLGPSGAAADDMEESALYSNLLNQTKALGSKALDKQFSSGMMGMFGNQEIGVGQVFHHWASLVSRAPRRSNSNSPMRQPQQSIGSNVAPMGTGIVGADGEFQRPETTRAAAQPPPPLETLDAPALKERAVAAGVAPEALEQAEAEGLEPEKLVELIKEADAPAAEERRTQLKSMSVAALVTRATAAGVSPEKIEAMVKQMEASASPAAESAATTSPAAESAATVGAGADGSTRAGADGSAGAAGSGSADVARGGSAGAGGGGTVGVEGDTSIAAFAADPEQVAELIALIEETEGPASLVGNPAFSPQSSSSPRDSTSPPREAQRTSAPAPQRSGGSSGGSSSATNVSSSGRSNSPVRRGRSPDGKRVGDRSEVGRSTSGNSGSRPSSRASPNYERATTPATQTDRKPQEDALAKQVEERLGRKMEAKVVELQMQTDIKDLKAAMERHANELRAQTNSEELDKLREELAKCQGELASVKSAADAAGRAATEAAASAAKANEGLGGLQKEMAETDLGKLTAEVKKLGELGPQLTKLEGAFGSAASEWDAAVAEMQSRLDPLNNVPKTLHELMNEVGRKVDSAELGRIQMALEDLGKELADVRTAAGQAAEKASQSGLPQDALDALKDLTELKNMKSTMKQHAKKLADLFNKKASIDDINHATSMMKELDQKLAAEVDSRASSIMGEMGATRNELQAKLDSIGRTIDEKADEAWLKTLEDQIRLEMEALRKKAGGKGISPQALEAKLAELRAKLSEAGGLHEAGSAVFRCIACDRPLPSVDGWKGPQPQHQHQPAGSGGGQIGGPDRKRKGLKENHAEVIMKGGFPMSNPKYDKQKTKGPAFGKGGAHGSTPALRGDGGSAAGMGGRPKNLPPLQPPETPDTSSRPASGGRKGSAGRRERLSHDGGYSRSSVAADGAWPPPSVPHYDAWGTDEGRSRPITPDGGR